MASKTKIKFHPAEVFWVQIDGDGASWRCSLCKASGRVPTGVNVHTLQVFGNNLKWEHRHCNDTARVPDEHPDAAAVPATSGLRTAIERRRGGT